MITDKTAPAESGGTELLPCPFCGSQYGPFINRAKYTTWEKEGQIFGPFIIVECDNCGAETNGHESDESFAIQSWNTRAEPLTASNAGERDGEVMRAFDYLTRNIVGINSETCLTRVAYRTVRDALRARKESAQGQDD